MGDGPQPNSIFFLGEGPARDEVKVGLPFMGRAGKEFNLHYLPLAGLVRPEIRVDNATHCPMANYDNPSHEMARECSLRHLPQELRHTQPDLIVLMGGVACSLADTHIDLDTDHGLPQQNSLLDGLWSGTVFPTFHPAAGLHEGQMILLLRQDFANLGQHLKGRLVLPVDAHPAPVLRLLRGRHGLDDVLPLGFTRGPRNPFAAYLEVAIDTESFSLRGAPWCLSFSLDPDHGYVILSSDHEALHRFAQWLRWQNPVILLHHSLHDIPVLRDMEIAGFRYRDTMIDAYHLANVPQGLKALGWRLLGVRMRSFEDTVLPHSLPVALDYVATAAQELESSLTFQHQLKSGPRKGHYETRPLPGADKPAMGTWRKLQKILKEPSADPWKRWTGWHPHDRALLVNLMGREMPQPSIAHVPLPEAVSYAALDAVVTLRIHRVLRGKRLVL
jgi:DNA polymerase